MPIMQPISLVGAPVAPSASTGSAATASGDGAGFAALLSGTALTPPAVPGMPANPPATAAFPVLAGNPLAGATTMSGENPAAATTIDTVDTASTTPVVAAQAETSANAVEAAPTPATAIIHAETSLPGEAVVAADAGEVPPQNSTPDRPAGKAKLKPETAIDAYMPEKVLPTTIAADGNAKPIAKVEGQATATPAPAAPLAPAADGQIARPDEKPAKGEDIAMLAVAAPVQPMTAAVIVAAAPSGTATGASQPAKAQKAGDPIVGSQPVRSGVVELANPETGKKDVASIEESVEMSDPRSKVEGKETAPRDQTAPAQRDQAAPRDFSAALNAARTSNVADTPRTAEVKAAAQPAPAPQQDQVVRASAIGHDMGIALSRHADSKGDQVVTLRLDPGHLGRIEVKLAVDDKGMMTARVAADHHHTLDLIRRDTDTLVRTLNDAGVRTDAQGFRFDGNMSGGQQQAAWGGQQGSGNGRHTPFQSGTHTASDEMNETLHPGQMQSLGIASGRVDLLA